MSATYVDFENRRALLVDDGDYKISLTTVQDMAGIVAEALDYPGQWPTIGGFSGSEITLAELIQLGEETRGMYANNFFFFWDYLTAFRPLSC